MAYQGYILLEYLREASSKEITHMRILDKRNSGEEVCVVVRAVDVYGSQHYLEPLGMRCLKDSGTKDVLVHLVDQGISFPGAEIIIPPRTSLSLFQTNFALYEPWFKSFDREFMDKYWDTVCVQKGSGSIFYVWTQDCRP